MLKRIVGKLESYLSLPNWKSFIESFCLSTISLFGNQISYIITNIFFSNYTITIFNISITIAKNIFPELQNFCRKFLLCIFIFFCERIFVENYYDLFSSFLYRELLLFIFVFCLLRNLYCMTFLYSFETISLNIQRIFEGCKQLASSSSLSSFSDSYYCDVICKIHHFNWKCQIFLIFWVKIHWIQHFNHKLSIFFFDFGLSQQCANSRFGLKKFCNNLILGSEFLLKNRPNNNH